MTQKTLTKPFNELTPQELERRKNFDCGEQSLNDYLDDSLSPLEAWKNMDNEYNVYLKSLQHTFKLYCPKK